MELPPKVVSVSEDMAIGTSQPSSAREVQSGRAERYTSWSHERSKDQARVGNQVLSAPEKLQKQRPIRLQINIMPGGMMANSNRPESASLLANGPIFVDDIKRRLVEAGLSWGPLMPRDGGSGNPPEGQSLDGARLLFRGMPLKLDVPLQAQGVSDGSELRLLRSRVAFQRRGHELRSRSAHGPSTPRGLLMIPGMPPWKPCLGRKGLEDGQLPLQETSDKVLDIRPDQNDSALDFELLKAQVTKDLKSLETGLKKILGPAVNQVDLNTSNENRPRSNSMLQAKKLNCPGAAKSLPGMTPNNNTSNHGVNLADVPTRLLFQEVKSRAPGNPLKHTSVW